MADDISRAAALLAVALSREGPLDENDLFRAWRRQRARLAAQVKAAAGPTAQDGSETDDSAVFTPELTEDEPGEPGDPTLSDDSLDVSFPWWRRG